MKNKIKDFKNLLKLTFILLLSFKRTCNGDSLHYIVKLSYFVSATEFMYASISCNSITLKNSVKKYKKKIDKILFFCVQLIIKQI